MWNVPSKERLDCIPRLYETENIRLADKIIYLHFFIGACDWFVVEYDGEDIFFGFAVLNGDTINAEWNYFSFNELKAQKVSFLEIDCDLYWHLVPAKQVPLINCHLNEW